MEEYKNNLQTSGSFLNNSLSTNGSDIFIKTESTKPVQLGGHGALVLFKLPHKKSKSVCKIPIQENNFVTDGGLKEKKMKYYNSTTFNKPTKKLSQSSKEEEREKTKSENIQEVKSYKPPMKRKKQIVSEEKLQKTKIQENLKNLTKVIGASLAKSINKKDNHQEEEKKSNKTKSSNRSLRNSNDNSKEMHCDHFNKRNHSANFKQEDSKNSEKEDRPKRNNFLSPTSNNELNSYHKSMPNSKQKSPNQSVSKILSERERIELMEQLVKNKEEEIIREVQKEVLKKGKQTNDKIQKKLKCLNEKGLLENIDFEADTAQMSAEEQNVVMNRITRRTSNVPQTQVRSHSHNDINHVIRKPKIDSLEYLARIYHERNENIVEGNSFRQSHSHSKLSQEQRNENDNDDDEPNFKFASKKHNRKPEEIYRFILQKRQEEKLKAVRIENETNTRNLQILVELAKLNEKIKSKTKVKNNHYVGSCKNFSIPPKKNNEPNLDTDESTIIDPNEYYYALLESKQIISPKDEIPISSKSKEEFLQFINNQEENILKCSGKISNNDIDKFIELKSRALNTINRANQILENTNIESLLNKKENEHSMNNSLESIPSLHSSIKIPSSMDGANKLNEAFDYFGQVIKNVVLKYCLRRVKASAQSEPEHSEELIGEEILQRQSIGFQYLTAILKKSSFEILINHVNKLSYLDVLNALFAPIKRRAFYSIGLYGELKIRASHFVNTLEYLIKRNVMERIYLKANHELIAAEDEMNEDEQLNESDMYQKELEEQLEREGERYKSIEEDNQEMDQNYLNEEDKEEYYKIFKRVFSMMTLPHLKEAFDNITTHEKRNLSKSNISSLRSSSVKYNTFLHEYSSEKSFLLYPNSYDSHRLHRIHMLIERQRMEAGVYDQDRESERNERSSNNSKSHRKFDFEMEMSMSNSQSRRSSRHCRSFNERRLDYSEGEVSKPRENILNKSKDKEITQSQEKEISKKENSDIIIENAIGQNISQQSIPLTNSIEFNLKENLNKQILTEEGKNNIKDISLEESKTESIINNKKHEEVRYPDEPKVNLEETTKSQENKGKDQAEEFTLRNKFNNVLQSATSDYEASPNNQVISEQDISADRDLTSDIDWGHTMSQSKSSGSQRDFQFPSNLNKDSSATKQTTKIIDEEQSASEGEKKSEQVIDDGANYDFGLVEDIPDNEEIHNISDLIKLEQSEQVGESQTLKESSLQVEEKNDNKEEKNEIEIKQPKENLIPSSFIKSIESDGEDYFKISNTKLSNDNILSHNKRYDTTDEEKELHQGKETRDIPIEEEEVGQVVPNLEEFAEELTEVILKDLLNKEILDKDVDLIPKKSRFLDIPVSPNTSTTSILSKSSSTIFTKPVHEQKKEISISLYNNKIADKLITKISNEFTANFDSIFRELTTPIKYDSHLLLNAINTRNAKLLKQSFTNIKCPPFFDKQRILSEFQLINKDIREKDNFTSDNYYDNILNECMIDAANEVLRKERIYGDLGEPLPGSSRSRIIKYKHTTQSAPKLNEVLKKELKAMTNFKMGLIAENHEYLEPEQLNLEREKRLMENITHELKEVDDAWKNHEIEETQVKLELSELVLEQLLNEAVEILEHVQLSRRKPSLYQMKSIYACEDIPRLSFQQYNTENDCDNINQ